MSLNKSEEFTRHFMPSVSLDILLMPETSVQLIGPLVRVLDGLCSFDVSTRLFMVTETEACVLRSSVDYRTIVQGTVKLKLEIGMSCTLTSWYLTVHTLA